MLIDAKNKINNECIETEMTSISFAGSAEFNKLTKDLSFNYINFFSGVISEKTYKNINREVMEEWTNISVSAIKGDSIGLDMDDSMRCFADKLTSHENVRNIYFHSANNELWIVLKTDDYASVKELYSIFFECCEDNEFNFITCTEEQIVLSEVPECLKKYH